MHWSLLHLGANLAGVAVLAALGWVARLPCAAALAWGAAWPLTQLGLALRPELTHYGGLSGVLHAGVAVAALWLVLGAPKTGLGLAGTEPNAALAAHRAAPRPDAEGRERKLRGRRQRGSGQWRRAVGAAIALGLVMKLLLEAPWGPALRRAADWDIAIAPLAHATGAAAGLLCAAIAWLLCAQQAKQRHLAAPSAGHVD